MTVVDTKSAIISGITGQDGRFLSELLIGKGYEVYGLIRRLSTPNLKNIQHLVDNESVNLIGGDLADQSSIMNAISISNPDEIYHLGAQSFVGESWNQAEYTINITGVGSLRVFECAKHMNNNIRIYQASSSEMFGLANGICPQNENTPMIPRSPYGCAKLLAHNTARVYRESYNMFISCGILFNHESENRGIEFVSRKISDGVARIKLGLEQELKLGNIRAKRDWSYAKDMTYGMYLMLQQDNPDDFVLCSGESHSVREFIEIAFDHAKLGNWENYVKFDKSLFRPSEIYELRGDYSKAKEKLGWKPKTSFRQLVELMVDNDIKLLQKK